MEKIISELSNIPHGTLQLLTGLSGTWWDFVPGVCLIFAVLFTPKYLKLYLEYKRSVKELEVALENGRKKVNIPGNKAKSRKRRSVSQSKKRIPPPNSVAQKGKTRKDTTTKKEKG